MRAFRDLPRFARRRRDGGDLRARFAPRDDEKAVAALDTQVPGGGWRRTMPPTMDRILADDFVPRDGAAARPSTRSSCWTPRAPRNEIRYEKQVEIDGDAEGARCGENTAVVTALLWIK